MSDVSIWSDRKRVLDAEQFRRETLVEPLWSPEWWVFGTCPKRWCRAVAGEPCIAPPRAPGASGRILRNPHPRRPRLQDFGGRALDVP